MSDRDGSATEVLVEAGVGINACARSTDTDGVVVWVRNVADVRRLLSGGVPEDAIGVLPLAGSTVLAPIVESFRGLVCLSGTSRSHLGIISRELGIACVMGGTLSAELAEGDRIRLQSSAAPDAAAKIWIVGNGR